MRAWPFLILLVSSCGAPRTSAPKSPPTPVIAPAYARWPLLVVSDVDGLALFRDEANEANAILAEWARGHGIGVVDVARSNEIFNRAWRGEHATSGAKCGLPLGAAEARERWSGELGAGGTLNGSVSCTAQSKCTLHVSASDTTHGDEATLAEWEAPFDAHAPFASALRASVAALAPYREESNGAGGLGLGGLASGIVAEPEHVSIETLSAHALDDEAATEGAIELPDALASLRGCFTTRSSAELLVAADESGRIARCEPPYGDDDAARCTCKALASGATVRSNARRKRFVVSVYHDAADVVAAERYVVRAWSNTYLTHEKTSDGERYRPAVSDRSIDAWRPPREATYAVCFADLTNATLHFRVRTEFDAVGNAVKADVQRTSGEPAATDAQVKCLARAFLASRAPCPATANTTADAEVTVSSRLITAGN